MSTAIHHQTLYRVRYSDTDKMGVVYHGNYLRLFEIGRTEMLRSIGLPYAELERQGYMLPVLESYASYTIPAMYDDELLIATTFTPEYSARMTIEYVITKSEATLVTGWTRHSFVTVDQFRPVRPPRIFLDVVGAYLA